MRRSAKQALRYFLLLGPLAAMGACGSDPDAPATQPGTDAGTETSTVDDSGSVEDGAAEGGADVSPEAGSGKEGEACKADGTCEPSNRCDVFTNRCVHCDPGTANCDCGVGGACSTGLTCFKDHCIDSSKVPPAKPVCYTPCEESLSTATGTRLCDADRLMEGCVGGRTCVDGSCLAAGETKAVCKSDLDCPSFQTCLAGGCYSNCTSSSDCAPGLVCQQKACRPPCTVGGASCPTGFNCSTKDGVSGVCTLIAPSPAKPGSMPAGSFAIKNAKVTLTNTKPSGNFVITAATGGTYDQKFTVRKLWHRVYRPGKPVEDVQTQINPSTKAYNTCSPSKPADCVMPWLEMSLGGTKTTGDTISATAISGCTTEAGATIPCPAIQVNVPPGTIDASRWEGELLIEGPNGTQQVHLDYATRPEGQFSGEMYYFGTFNDEGLDAFLADGSKPLPKNALLQAWYAFKGVGGATLPGGREELEAMLTSARTGSWNFKETKSRCVSVTGNDKAVCYPYTTSSGVRTFVNDRTVAPVPSGLSELPLALNLRVDPTASNRFIGRVDSSATMHYPGNPAVAIKLSVDPTLSGTACSKKVGDACAVFLGAGDTTNNIVRVAVGGRSLLKSYLPSPNCPAGTQRFDVPWLVPGFTAYTDLGSPTRTRGECRITNLPFDSFSSSDPVDENANLAGGSPVPDGVTRERKLEFYDGALIDQNDFVLLFRESFGGFIDTSPVYAYGFARLKRAQAALAETDYVGTAPKTIPATTSTVGGAKCDPAFEAAYGLKGLSVTEKVRMLIEGSAAASMEALATENVHYLCGDTGLIDGGEKDFGAAPVRVPCPLGSNITYFYTPTLTQAQIAAEGCQKVDSTTKRGSCEKILGDWIALGAAVMPVVYKCDPKTSGGIYCDTNTSNRKADKLFYKNPPTTTAPPLLSLRALIDDAFRYKTRFKSSAGATPGFAPTQCMPLGADLTPYCYDAPQIEEARKRVDCLIQTYRTERSTAGFDPASLDAFLRGAFSHFNSKADGTGTNFDGFERLYAELMVVLGDEALTAAYASRFDLAGASAASFPGYNDGDKNKGFEKNGMNLTGVPGAEMVQLHRAVEYYQLALDRLYEHGPDFKAALATGTVDTGTNFISPSTVTEYLERLIRAASQKSRAWSEIAKRYQQFHRPDLARRVLKRAYVSTHLEGALLDSLMLDIMKRSTSADRDGIRASIEFAQITFRMSLLDMRENFAKITDDQTYFGYAPDYVPFPVVDGAASSAFKQIYASAQSKTATAYERENLALTSNRTGRVEAAKFNAELVNIRTTYENQLADLCGTFVGDDGIVYPAITKYGEKSAKTRLFGDPCGQVGNGAIHTARADIKAQQLAFAAVRLKYEHMKQERANEEERLTKQCAAIKSLADLQLKVSSGIIDLNHDSAEMAANMHLAGSLLQTLVDVAESSNCENTGCPAAIAKGVAVGAAGAASAASTFIMERKMADRQKSISEKELSLTVAGTTSGCDLAKIDSEARVKSIVLQMDELDLETLQVINTALTASATLESKQNEARRQQTLQAQAEQLTINVEAAENDPNVRIYQNDAVINADFSFNDAMSAAYRLTRIFEYYTGQSYKKKEQLFLIRMVAAGTYNLQNYLTDLDNAFTAYEETYGAPSLRVLRVSLLDDILKVPRLDKDGRDVGEEDRKKQLRAALLEPARLDGNGYLVLPFNTSIRSLSPLTRTHKIQRVEANLILGTPGDNIARIYLRASGTGVVRNLAGDSDYYLFPKRTAVINPKLNSSMVYDPEVYRNYSFRDRPLANSLWELVINQKDEMVNRDMDLQSLSDVELFFYYTDVTAL